MSNKKPKILYVAEVLLPGRKASSIHVMRMCKAMADQGYQVRLLAYRSKDYKSKKDIFQYYGVSPDFEIKALRVPGQGRPAVIILAVWAALQAMIFRPHIAYTRAVLSAFAFSFTARAFAFESHSFLPQAPKKWLLTFFNSFIKKSGYLGTIVISDALKQLYIKQGIEGDQMLVAHDGADEKPLDTSAPLKGGFGFNVGYFGSVFEGRGIDVIIQMASERPDIGFHVFGADASDLTEELKAPSNLLFYGFVSPSEVHLYRNVCDVLLAPYQAEVYVSGKAAYSTSAYMSPLKIFEYMSARKAIIASDLPALREVLDRDTALLVSYNKAGEWLQALDRLHKNGDMREKLGKSAYNKFLKTYTWHRRAAVILGWLENRLDGKSIGIT